MNTVSLLTQSADYTNFPEETSSYITNLFYQICEQSGRPNESVTAVERCKELLASGYIPITWSNFPIEPFHLESQRDFLRKCFRAAVIHGNLPLIRLFLEQNITGLESAEELRLLLEPSKYSCLGFPVKLELLKLLLLYGFEDTHNRVLRSACYTRDVELARTLVIWDEIVLDSSLEEHVADRSKFNFFRDLYEARLVKDINLLWPVNSAIIQLLRQLKLHRDRRESLFVYLIQSCYTRPDFGINRLLDDLEFGLRRFLRQLYNVLFY